ncbi:MAG TPA: acyltransferase family protein [Candidatus Acidoferrales bacterium]|nr:acyltransferase family protein [Candidatus Acidoferrales bacterium]
MHSNTNERTASKRIHWIDIARGIAIVLVIYGHLFSTDQQRYLIYAFHMPLFFFISGLVFKPITAKPLLFIALKYFKQLLIPYYIFAVLTYIFALISQTASLSLSGTAYQLFGILYGSGSDGMLGYNVVLWFLPCLFITKLTLAVITRKISQTRHILLFLVASGTVGAFLSYATPWLKLPFGFEIALNSLPFLGAGYLFMTHKRFLGNFIKYKLPIAAASLILTSCIATVDYQLSGHQVDLRINRIDIVPLFYLGAFGGISTWMAVSQLIAKSVFLEYIGKHSLVIFAWHNILLVDLREIVGSLLTQDVLNSIQPFMSTIYTGMAISIILFSRKVFVKLKVAYRYVPFIKQ